MPPSLRICLLFPPLLLLRARSIPRWPYRKLNSVQKLYETFERYKRDAVLNGNLTGGEECEVGALCSLFSVRGASGAAAPRLCYC